MSEALSTRQKVALCAALGTGVVVGATGLVVYQRLCQVSVGHTPVRMLLTSPYFQRVGLRVTGEDFSQEIATPTTNIERLRLDIEHLRGAVRPSIDVIETEDGKRPLKSALKKSSRYAADEDSSQTAELTVGQPPVAPLPGAGGRHRRNLSWCSTKTSGSASSSGTEYFSAISSDDEDYLTPPDVDQDHAAVPGSGLGYEEANMVELFARLDDLMEGSQEQQQLALKLITDSLEDYNTNPSFLWRLCKAQYLNAVLAGQDGARDIKKDLIQEAVQSGERALGLDQRNSEAHKWYAISLGSRGEFQVLLCELVTK